MGAVSSVIKTERNNIGVANISDQSARKYKETFSIEIEDKANCILYSNLLVVTLNTKLLLKVAGLLLL
jgi:hypothetical protein